LFRIIDFLINFPIFSIIHNIIYRYTHPLQKDKHHIVEEIESATNVLANALYERVMSYLLLIFEDHVITYLWSHMVIQMN
jgi:hypothetical protein